MYYSYRSAVIIIDNIIHSINIPDVMFITYIYHTYMCHHNIIIMSILCSEGRERQRVFLVSRISLPLVSSLSSTNILIY